MKCSVSFSLSLYSFPSRLFLSLSFSLISNVLSLFERPWPFSSFCSISLSVSLFTGNHFLPVACYPYSFLDTIVSLSRSLSRCTNFYENIYYQWLIHNSMTNCANEKAKQIKTTNNHRNEGNSSVKRRSFRQRGHVRSILNHSSRQARWKACSQAKRSVLFELNASRQIRHWSSFVSVLLDDARSRSR